MSNSIAINQNLNHEPENPFVVRHKGVVANAIHSQAFLFGEPDMDAFKRTIAPPCECGCGALVNWHYQSKKWNRFLRGHNPGRYRRFKRINPPLCACGCKAEVEWSDQGRRWNKYLLWHMGSGERYSKETRQKISEGNKKHVYSEERLKKSRAQCLKMAALNKGKPLSKEHKNNVSKANIGKHFHFGKHNPNWRGGTSTEPYCFIWSDFIWSDIEYKQLIKDRDNNKCQNPDYWKTANHLSLNVHHIDYNKQHCEFENLITLCNSCNSRANFNRKNWIIFYQNILMIKHGYKYE